MPARIFGGIARSSESAIPVLRAAQCDTALGPHITFVRATSGTRYNSAGTLVTMAAAQPRINFDPVTLAAKGLLVEEARTNLCLRSEDFTNASWQTAGTATVTANTTVSPDGTQNADTVTANAADSIIYQQIAVSASTTYTGSFYMKAATNTTVTIYILTAGFAALGSQVCNVTTQWQRFSVTAATGVNTSILLSIGGGATFSTPEAVIPWGAQLEAGAFATSYIPTVAAQATRDADAATVTGAAFTALYNAAAWGAYLRFHLPNASGTQPILSFDDGTANNRVEIYASGTSLKLKVVTGGAQQCDTTLGTIAANTTYKLAISQDGGAFLSTLNGAAEVSATAASMPTVDRARLGHNQAGSYLNGHLHTWDAYRRTLPVRERLELTA